MLFSAEFFDLQFTFAERAQALSGMPLGQALFQYTNFYVRFGLGRAFDAAHPRWREYLAGLRTAENGRRWTYEFYSRAPERTTAPEVTASVGCFAYALAEGGAVRLHFRSEDGDGGSPLRAARAEQRRVELTELFRHMKHTLGLHAQVVGVSWLYHLAAYRRLFPPEYGTSACAVHGRFRGMPLWGQFVDYRGALKPTLAGALSSALSACTRSADLAACFPLPVLTVHAPAQLFYNFYGL